MLADQMEVNVEPRPGHRPSFVCQEQGLVWICMRTPLKISDDGGQRAEGRVGLKYYYD